jgi:hypothetical protein
MGQVIPSLQAIEEMIDDYPGSPLINPRRFWGQRLGGYFGACDNCGYPINFWLKYGHRITPIVDGAYLFRLAFPFVCPGCGYIVTTLRLYARETLVVGYGNVHSNE